MNQQKKQPKNIVLNKEYPPVRQTHSLPMCSIGTITIYGLAEGKLLPQDMHGLKEVVEKYCRENHIFTRSISVASR